MDRLKLPLLNLALLLAATATGGYAQDSTGGAADEKASSPQAKTTPSPQSAEKQKSKKVWTNEELSSVKGSVSVVGTQNPTAGNIDAKKPGSYQANHDKALRQRQIAKYRDQIRQLQEQIDLDDKRITQLKNFNGENNAPANGINPARGYNMVPLEEQVKKLEERNKQLQAKIQDLEYEAMKSGIEPGELR